MLNTSFFLITRPIHRAVLALLSAIIVFFLLPVSWDFLIKLLGAWLIFAVVYLLICWEAICKMNAQQVAKKASVEDGSRAFVFGFILFGTFGCFVGIFLSVVGQDDQSISENLLVGITLASMIASWLLIHTTYLFHYARLYYKNSKLKKGLIFPGNEEPDYLDFAYFSFGLGTTFQVSDVEIQAKNIRRVAFFHGLLSFGLNTYVIALTINILSGLIH